MPMLNYSLYSAVPTKSHAKGLVSDSEIFFSNHTFLYSLTSKPNFIGTVDYEITNIMNLNQNFLILTRKRMYLMNKMGEILSTYKKEAKYCEAIGNSLVLAVKNYVEFYHLNDEYRLCLDKRCGVHSDDVYFLKKIDNFLFSASNDRTLRMHYNGRTPVVSTQRSKIVNVFIINHDPMEMVIVTEGGGIYWQNIYLDSLDDKSFEKNKNVYETTNKIFLEGKVYSALSKGNKIFLIFEESEKRKLIVLEDQKIKMEIEINEIFYEMEWNKNRPEILLKNENGIKVFDLLEAKIMDKVDFPHILCMSEDKNKLALGCSDKFIRIYDDAQLISKVIDQKALGNNFNVYKIKNVVFSITGSGYVSVFDLNNQVCFRSFHISCRVSASALNEDGTLLFLSDFETNEIYVIDVMRSKKVDTIDNLSPVLSMCIFKSYLYVLTTTSLTKYDLYNSTNNSIDFSGNALTFGEYLGASTDKAVYLFDKNLNLLTTLECKLEGRNISECFIKSKPITKISFDHLGNVLVGGCVNQIYMLNEDTSKKYKVSYNKELENYNERKGKEEEERIFEEKNMIETLMLIHSKNSATFYVLSRHSLLIYKAKEHKILFDSLETEKSAESFFENKDYSSSLFLALKLNLNELIKRIIRETCFRPNYTKYFTEKLSEIIVEMIEQNDALDNAIIWLREVAMQIELKEDLKNKAKRILEGIRKEGWNLYRKQLINLKNI